MKKTVLLICVIMILGGALTGCGSSTNDNSGASTSPEIVPGAATTLPATTPPETAPPDTSIQAESDPDTAEGGKTLVAYYSASGYTKAVAETIAETANADLFELVPIEIYSDAELNWRDRDSRVSKEYADQSLRAIELISTAAPNWDEYDTVFVGYPIWWGIAAWPLDGFVKANDFTGKTVIPFCTSTTSGLGQSGELLAEQAGTGNWQEGIRFRSGVSAEDVISWANEVLER